MHRFKRSGKTWWQKPLVELNGDVLPAELAVLWLEIGDDEEGLWINSRGTKTGVLGFKRSAGRYHTERRPLPDQVSLFLQRAYDDDVIAKGCPDLVVWKGGCESFRFVEVKCPLWDRLTPEQISFKAYARSRCIDTKVVEWVFDDN